MGGVAVMAWGQPRATTDVDALLIPVPGGTPPLVAALHAEGLGVDPRDFDDAARDGSHVTVFDAGSVFHVDVKLAQTEHERREVEEAVDIPFLGGRLLVVSAIDTVAHKLVFGSPQDIADARSILVRQGGRLDLLRLRNLANRLGVEDALDDLLSSVRG